MCIILKFTPASFFFFGIQQKLLLVLLLVVVTTLSVSSWLTLREEKQHSIKIINDRGNDISRFVSKVLTYSVVGYDYHTTDLLLKEITSSKEVGYAKVVNIKGKIFSQSGTMIDDVNRMQLFVTDIKIDNEKIGELTLGLNTNIATNHFSAQGFKSFTREILITIIIVLAEFFALSYLIMRPVKIITKSLQESKDHKKNKKVSIIPLNSNDEFGHLASQFNDLNLNLCRANHELLNRVHFADKQLRQNVKDLKKQKAELTQMNERFQRLSITDELTGLYNRRYFEEHLEKEISLTKRHGDDMSLILVDIDHFKNINDSYGHVHGDEVLKQVANTIHNRVRNTDITCRIGGEEFIIICKRMDKQRAIELAQQLRKTIEELIIPIAEYNVSVTISAGIVTLTHSNFHSHSEHLYRFADLALYFSKENGRNAATHHDDIDSSSQQQITQG